jgi:hypothetical protein
MQLARIRLASQFLTAPSAEPLEQLVSRFGGLQGQDLPGVKWSVGIRAKHATLADVDRALTEGRLVRSSPMRGTLHLVAASDARWLVELTAPGNLKRAAYRSKQLELDEKTIARAMKVFEKALKNRAHLTRHELADALEHGKISAAGQRTYYLLWHATMRGLISSGAPRGKEPTFTLADHWLPRVKAPSDPAAELALRYFTTRGPATKDDFAWWSSLPAAQVRGAMEAVAPQLAHEDGLFWSKDVKPAPAKHALALPGFDEFLLGYTDRSAVLDATHAGKWCPGSNGIFMPFLVLDGRVVGLWNKKAELKPFTKLTATERERLDDAVQRSSKFALSAA